MKRRYYKLVWMFVLVPVALAGVQCTTSGFFGAGPVVLRAVALSNTSILVTFSMPMEDAAEAVGFYRLPGSGLNISAASLSADNTSVTLTTSPQLDVEYTLEVSDIRSRDGQVLDPLHSTVTFYGMLPPGMASTSTVDAESPRVVGAAATSNTTVIVTFSEPVDEGAEEPDHYSIVGADSPAVIMVLSAELSADKAVVTLTTLSLTEVVYKLKVTNVRDLAGNPLAAPDLLQTSVTTSGVDPSVAYFTGIPPSVIPDADPTSLDKDLDGLTDKQEHQGWVVTIVLSNGQTEQRNVTSDPFNPDTDGDGVGDLDEHNNITDPRDADTDRDQLSDADELNVYRSSPIEQDTDFDGLDDSEEVDFFGTSAILADTDGDGFDDYDELILSYRNARMADLPRPKITIGDVDLRLDERFSYTDSEGQSHTVTDSSSTTLGKTETETYATSDTDTTSSTIEESATIGAEVGFPALSGSVSASVTISGSQTEEQSYQVTEESATETQEVYQESLEKSQTYDAASSVTREILGASIAASVDIETAGIIAFSIENIEITVLQQDPQDRSRFLPVATIGPDDPALALTLSPLIPRRGPFRFSAENPFPSMIEDLMRSPRGLLFKVANFDILDEFGRNFAFTSQAINDRTAGIVIDYGDGTVDRFRVATNSTFDAQGRPVGITMIEALTNILSIDYGTRTNNDGVEILTRVNDVETDMTPNPEARFWVVFGSNGVLTSEDFNNISLHSRQNFSLAYVQDKDDDNLFAREEFLYGSSDLNPDSDNDTLPDYDEVRVGWTVQIEGVNPYTGFSDPTRVDSDGDGLDDNTEKNNGTDPTKRDTDEDAVSDTDEIEGYTVTLRDGTVLNNVTSDPLNRDTDGDTALDGMERDRGADPNNGTDGGTIIDTDYDGIMDTDEEIGWNDLTIVDINGVGTVVAVSSDRLIQDTDEDGLTDMDECGEYNEATGTCSGISNPEDPDSDADGLDDIDEIQTHLTDPLKVDTDADGLDDNFELNEGWLVQLADDPSSMQVFSDPLVADMDNDGLDDSDERDTGTDPNNADTDSDGIGDGRELELGTNPVGADQKVRFAYTSITVLGDCDGGDDGGDFSGQLKLTIDGTTHNVQSVGIIDGTDEGDTENFDSGLTFIASASSNSSVVAESSSIEEEDAWPNPDDKLGSFSTGFNYPYSNHTEQWSLDDGSDCEIVVTLTITVYN